MDLLPHPILAGGGRREIVTQTLSPLPQSLDTPDTASWGLSEKMPPAPFPSHLYFSWAWKSGIKFGS